jgi:hypothetical protein
LFVADVGRHIDEKGRTIAIAAKMPLDAARRDVASSAEARGVAIGTAAALLFGLAAMTLLLFF